MESVVILPVRKKLLIILKFLLIMQRECKGKIMMNILAFC